MSDMTEIGAGAPPDEPADTPSSSQPWSPATDATTHEQAPAEKAPPKRKAAARPAKAAPAAATPTASEEEPEDTVAAPETAAPETFEGERIAKAIARAGIASRRDAEEMIREGRVTLNGAVIDSPALNVTESDRITVDGEPLPARERTRLWIFHKPRGLVTTARDPEGRQTVFEALPEEMPRVVAVGRLDINTEGLLLLTNDGGLAKVIAHPDTGWLRRYRVRAHGETTQVELDRLRKGVTVDGMEYGPVEATLDRVQGDNLWITLGLREGKNREVKRILEHLGLSVNRLIRLSFGPFQLGELEVGLVEEVRTKVLKEQLGRSLSEAAGVDFDSAVREPVAPFGSPKAAARGSEAPPARQRRDAPSGDRRPRGAPAAPAKPARVPTGGAGPGPRRSVWRSADETEAAAGFVRPSKPPRRGADPKAERAVAAERGRERVGAIKTGERRVVVERLKASPPEPVAEPHRRTRFRKSGDEAPRGGDMPRSGAREERPSRGASSGERPSRPPVRSRDAGGERAEGGRPAARPFRSSDRPSGGGRSFGEKPFGAAKPGRSAGPRSEGDRAGSGRDDRAGSGKEGGYRGGGGKPGFKGAAGAGASKGGGFKSGGFKGPRDQGERPRSGGGGRPPGGSGRTGGPSRPGGSGGRSGGGRPPRAGR